MYVTDQIHTVWESLFTGRSSLSAPTNFPSDAAHPRLCLFFWKHPSALLLSCTLVRSFNCVVCLSSLSDLFSCHRSCSSLWTLFGMTLSFLLLFIVPQSLSLSLCPGIQLLNSELLSSCVPPTAPQTGRCSDVKKRVTDYRVCKQR